MSSPQFNSVEEYLASLDPAKERTLRSVIDLILAQFPELESKISWNVPTIHRQGKYVVGLAAYKRHLTFSPWSPRVIQDFKVRLGKFVVFKNCFQLPVDWDIDRELVKDPGPGQTSRAGLAFLIIQRPGPQGRPLHLSQHNMYYQTQ